MVNHELVITFAAFCMMKHQLFCLQKKPDT
jgi:hypothetical protein